MKTKSIIAGMLSTMLLAVGCNKEDGGNRVTPEAGVKTYASFSVSLLNQSTRATSNDPNAVTEETKSTTSTSTSSTAGSWRLRARLF